MNIGAKRTCLHGAQVLQSRHDPRLVVVHGLLHDRKNETRVTRSRIARASYGVVFEMPYSRKTHPNRVVEYDPLTDKKFFPNQIHWLVKAGDTIIPSRPFRHTFTKRGAPKDLQQWTEKLVWSEGNPEHLPSSMAERKCPSYQTPRECNLTDWLDD